MPRNALSLLVLVSLGALAATPACGGATASDLVGGTGSSSGGGGSSGGADAAPDSGGAGLDSGVQFTSDTGIAPADAGIVLDTGAPADVSTVEEPPPASGPSVLCPMNGSPATCEPGDYCCVVGSAAQQDQTDNCQPSGKSCSGASVRCAKKTDCPTGQVCCGTIPNGTAYTEVACATTCTGLTKRTFCDPSANECPVTTMCLGSQLMPGYSVCQ
jgi:hypothetical protein